MINASTKKSSLLSTFIKDIDVAGDTAEEVTLTVAKFSDTGGGTIRTPGWMYEQWEALVDDGLATDTDNWNEKFTEQSGRNVNVAVNGIAKLLVKVSQQ